MTASDPDLDGSEDVGERFAWIGHQPRGQAAEQLAATYGRMGLPSTGEGLDHVLRIHGLMPPTLEQHLDFYRGILRDPGPLSRTEREIIGVVVSDRNGCLY